MYLKEWFFELEFIYSMCSSEHIKSIYFILLPYRGLLLAGGFSVREREFRGHESVKRVFAVGKTHGTWLHILCGTESSCLQEIS